MANVDELWQMATDLYARGQLSNDPSMKQMLMRARLTTILNRQKNYDAAAQSSGPSIRKSDRKIG